MKMKLALAGGVLLLAGSAGAATILTSDQQPTPTSVETTQPQQPAETPPADQTPAPAVAPDTSPDTTTPAPQPTPTPAPAPAPNPIDYTHYSSPAPGHTCRWTQDGWGTQVYYVDDRLCSSQPAPQTVTPTPAPADTPPAPTGGSSQ